MRSVRLWLLLGLGVGAAAVAVIGGLIVLVANQAPAAYSCGGELMVSGAPDPGQPGLVKCYVQAVRTHDSGLLAKIEMDGYPNPLPTPPQAQSPVQARFFVFDAGMGDERVTITFADGKGVTLRLATAPGDVPWSGPPAWRLAPDPYPP